MISPKTDTVRRVLQFDAFDGVLRHVLGGGRFISLKAHEHVCLYVARQMFSCLSPPIGEADIHQVLGDLLPVLECVLEGVEEPDPTLEYTAVGIADGLYVAWTGLDAFIEVATGNKLEFLPRPAMTTIAIDVYAVFFAMSDIYKSLETEDVDTAET
jgi:hypothetical protein